MRLEARGMEVRFEGVTAVDGVDLALDEGEILGLIGPNGAGKTTLVNAMSGFQHPSAGSVTLGDATTTGWPAHRLARHGLARTFQNIRLFGGLTVLENVEAAGVSVGLRRKAARTQAQELLAYLNLSSRAELRADQLPGGEERRLGVARALATDPKFLLLDEPAAGLNNQESAELTHALRELRTRFACALLVIEHDMSVIMNLCERVQVLDYGKTIALGTPTEIQGSEVVRAAYLGSSAADLPGEVHAPA
jgi:ABC-type branched-subunit amino acid transport system ATPase component